MSEGYSQERALVSEDSSYYDRVMDATIALTVVSFLLGLLSLVKIVGVQTRGGALNTLLFALLVVAVGGIGFVGLFSYLGVVPVTSRRVRGVGLGVPISLIALALVAVPLDISLATLFGLILLVQGITVGAAGIVSRLELVDTEPASSAGLLAGFGFGVLGFLVGTALGITFLGESLGWITGLGGGVGLFAITVFPREDIASTLPTAFLLGVLGLSVVTAMVAPGWQWDPQTIQGGLTGVVVIPLFVLLGSVVSGWAAGKCRAGFGAPGRQYGAFLVIILNAMLMVLVMISIVLFVATKGFVFAFHGFQIGALSVLVVLSPVFVVALNHARKPAGSDQWHSGARQLFRVLPLVAVSGFGALLLSIVVTRRTITVPFTYRVLQNRELIPVESTFQVTADPTVGTLLVVIPGVVLFGYFLRKYGSLSQVGRRLDRQHTIQRGLGLSVGAMVALVFLFGALGQTPLGLPLGGTVGLGAVVVATLGAAALAAAAFVGLLVGEGTPAERAHERAQVVKIGLFGGLGLSTVAVFVQLTAGVNPSLGPVDLVPVIAIFGVVVGLGVSLATVFARRSMATREASDRLRYRVIGEETVLGLVAATGFLTVAALHVAVTGVSFTMVGVTISDAGTLSWPMVMQPYIPLGKQPGGILPAVVGTIWLVVGASSFAVPLGVGAAVFLTEYAEQGRFTSVVEIATNSLWSTPSVVFGLFGAAFLIPRLGGDESLMSGMLVLGFMLLPLVLITSREAIKAVPDEYRDGSAALGVNQWQTIRSVVLPAALPGVVTGVILGIGRIAGETAPLILVLGSTLNETEAIDVLGSFQFTTSPPFVFNGALLEASAALPTQVWAVIAAGVSGSPSMGWASAFVLLIVVLSFYAIGIFTRKYFRRKLDYE
jgi:phosphate transport system permease protein